MKGGWVDLSPWERTQAESHESCEEWKAALRMCMGAPSTAAPGSESSSTTRTPSTSTANMMEQATSTVTQMMSSMMPTTTASVISRREYDFSPRSAKSPSSAGEVESPRADGLPALLAGTSQSHLPLATQLAQSQSARRAAEAECAALKRQAEAMSAQRRQMQAETTTAVNRLEDQLLEAAKRHAELAEAMQKQTRHLAEVDAARAKLATELATTQREMNEMKEAATEQLNRERRSMAVRISPHLPGLLRPPLLLVTFFPTPYVRRSALNAWPGRIS
jgi:hypothetical protein